MVKQLGVCGRLQRLRSAGAVRVVRMVDPETLPVKGVQLHRPRG